MKKQIIGLILTLSISISLAAPAFAAEPVEFNNNQAVSFVQNIDGQDVEYLVYENEGVNYVQYTVNGRTRIASYDTISGNLCLDGQVLAVVSPTSSDPLNSIISQIGITPYADEEEEWHLYDIQYGDITSDILTVVDWTSLLIGLVSGSIFVAPTIRDVVEEIAMTIVEENLPTVYYTRYYYYKTPIVSYRPETRSSWKFYSDPERTDLIGTLG